MRRDRVRDHTARIHALQGYAREFTRGQLEEPPRHAILCAHYGSVFANERRDPRRELRETMRLYAQDNHVHGTSLLERSDYSGARLEVAFRTRDPNTACLHGL